MLSFLFSTEAFLQSKLMLFVKNRDTRCSTKCVKIGLNIIKDLQLDTIVNVI